MSTLKKQTHNKPGLYTQSWMEPTLKCNVIQKSLTLPLNENKNPHDAK